jgi:hypothetical protein
VERTSPHNVLSAAIRRLQGEEYERPLRLFAVACCRRVWHLLTDDSRRDVGIVERYAHGATSEAELDAVADGNADISGYAAGGSGAEAADAVAWIAARALARSEPELLEELASLHRLLRDFVGEAAGLPIESQLRG